VDFGGKSNGREVYNMGLLMSTTVRAGLWRRWPVGNRTQACQEKKQ